MLSAPYTWMMTTQNALGASKFKLQGELPHGKDWSWALRVGSKTQVPSGNHRKYPNNLLSSFHNGNEIALPTDRQLMRGLGLPQLSVRLAFRNGYILAGWYLPDLAVSWSSPVPKSQKAVRHWGSHRDQADMCVGICMYITYTKGNRHWRWMLNISNVCHYWKALLFWIFYKQ